MTGETKENRKSPAESVLELVQLTISNTWNSFYGRVKKVKSMVKNGTIWPKFKKWVLKQLKYFRYPPRPNETLNPIPLASQLRIAL